LTALLRCAQRVAHVATLQRGLRRCLLPGNGKIDFYADMGAKLPFASWKTYVRFGLELAVEVLRPKGTEGILGRSD
jgi:hypothetical protein